MIGDGVGTIGKAKSKKQKAKSKGKRQEAKADPYGMTTKKATTTTTTTTATAIEMKFSFCSLLTEGVVYERSQGSDQGNESAYSGVAGGRAAEGGCLLAGMQLPLRGDALSGGESAAAGAAEAGTHQEPAAGALGI
jgi:hypothetical protein